MALPSFKSLFDDPRFQNASVEEQNRINSEYWADYDKENPNDPWAQQMRTATYGLIGTKQALALAPPIKQRELSLQKDAFEFSTKLGAVDKENLWESPEQRTQVVSQMQSEFEKRKAEIDKTTSLFRDPKVDEAMQPAWQALTSSASMGEVFNAPDTWSDTALKGVSYVASAGGSSDARDKARADYEKYRSTMSQDFGLTTDEVDDLVKHRLGKQADQVSQDVAGTIHFRDDLLVKPTSEVEKAIEQSKLPDSVKSLARTEAPQKIALFKTGVLNRVKKDYPELADDMTWTGKTDDDYAALTGKLNKDWPEQLGGGIAGAGLSGLFANVPSYAMAPQPGVVPVSSREQITNEIDRQRGMEAAAKKQQAVNELSSFINADKTKIFNVDAATIGQGIYSVGESVLLGAMTGGAGTALVSADRIAKAGKVGKALLGFSKGALNTAPVAGIYGAQQGIQTYEQALASDDPKVRENAANLAVGSAAIEFGVTTVFGGIGLGGTEDYASKLASPALRKEAAMTIGKAWKNLGKNLGEAVISEVPEEALITALDSVHIQQKLNPQMTDADVRKAIYDTIVSTALTTAPLGGIKAAKEGFKDFRNITTHDRSTDELKRESDDIYKAAAQEGLAEDQAAGGDATPPSAERVAELGAERSQLEERLKKTPPGGQPWLDLKERILEINQLIGEPTKTDEQDQTNPAGEPDAPQALQLPEVSVGPTAPAGSEPAGGNPQGTGPAEAQAQAPLETSPAPTGTPTETLPAGQAAPSVEGVAPVAQPTTTPTNEDQKGQVLTEPASPAPAGEAVVADDLRLATETRASIDERETTPEGRESARKQRKAAAQRLVAQLEPGDTVTDGDGNTLVVERLHPNGGVVFEGTPEPIDVATELTPGRVTLADGTVTEVPSMTIDKFSTTPSENQVQEAGGTPSEQGIPADTTAASEAKAGAALGSGQEQEAQEAFQTLKAEDIKAVAPHLSDDVAEDSAILFNIVAPDIQKPLELRGAAPAPKQEMVQGELFQQDNQQGLPQARTFVQSFQGTPPKGATRALIDYAGDPLLRGGDLGDLPAHTVKDIQEADDLIQSAAGKRGKVRVGRIRFNDFLTKLWKRHHRGKKPGWHNFRSARDIREMGRILAFEIGHALTKDGSGVDWYRSKIDGMYRELSKSFPELAEDTEDRFLFSVILAVTSNGQSVPDNLHDAILIYQKARGTGKLPTAAHTSRSERNAAVIKAFREVNSLIAESGWQGAKDALLEGMTVSQLQKKFGIKLAGELADHNVIGAMILGPKIGSFWGNLNGHYASVTMDLWFTRTMNRLSGDTSTVEPDAVSNAISELKGMPGLSADVKRDIRLWEKAREKNEGWTRVPSDIREEVEFLYDYAKTVFRQYAADGFRDRSDLNKTAQKIIKAIDGGEDTPDNGTHRKWMRDVINQAQKQLRENDINITNADLQAILWFHEKDLYTRFGATSTRGERTDYEKAAAPALARAGIGRASGSVNGDAAGDDGRSSGATTGPVRGDEQLSLFQAEQPQRPGVTRGSITFAADMSKAWITLMQHANASTFPHELAHFLRRFVLADNDEARALAERRGISVDEIQNLAKWAGVGADGVWTREAEEKFARGFERYLADGKAPTPALQVLFDKFSKYLKEIYGAIVGTAINVEISPEVRSVFDKLLAGPQAKAAPQAKPQAKAAPTPKVSKPSTPVDEISAKREYMDALRRKYGFPQYFSGDPVTDQMVTDEAVQALDAAKAGRPSKYKVGQDLVNELEGREKSPDAVEIALLVHEAKVLDAKLTRAYAGLEGSNSERQSNDLSGKIAAMEEQLNAISTLISETGTAAGRMLQSFKKVWDNKFDLVRMTAAYLRDKRAATGDPKATVSPEERKKIREVQTKLKEKKKAADDAVAAREKEVRAKEAEGVVNALAKDVRDKKAPAKQRVRDQLRAAFDVKSAVERLRARGFGARLEQSDAIGEFSFSSEDTGAYHYGDGGVGKDTTLSRMSGGRSTGHFGTGLYFLGSKTPLSRSDRPLKNVDLTGLRLAKPLEPGELHKQLKKFNGEVLEGRLLTFSQPRFLGARLASDIWMALLHNQVKTSQVEAAMKKVQSLFANSKNDGTRTPSTYLLQELGFDGVDVRGTTFDNGDYGSVVFTKGESPARKKLYRGGVNRPGLNYYTDNRDYAEKSYGGAIQETAVDESRIIDLTKEGTAPINSGYFIRLMREQGLEVKGLLTDEERGGIWQQIQNLNHTKLKKLLDDAGIEGIKWLEYGPPQGEDGAPQKGTAYLLTGRGEEQTLLQSELDPEILDDLATVGAGLILDHKLETLDDFTAAIVHEFGPEAMDYAQEIYQRSQDKIEAARKSLKIPKSPEQLLKEVDPEKELSNRMVFNMVRGYLLQGMDKDQVLRQVHKDLQTVWEEITFEEVSDAFTGYGKPKYPSTEKINVQLRELRNIERIKRQLDVVRSKQAPLKTGFQRDKPTPEIRALQKELKAAMKAAGIKTTRSNQLKSSLDAIKTRFRNELEDLQRAIDTRTALPPKKDKEEYDKATKDLKDKVDAKRAEYAAIFEDKTLTEKQQLAQALAAINRSIAEEEDMLAKGILNKPKRDKRVFDDPEFKAAEARLTALREARHAAQRALKPRKSAEQIALDAAIREARKGIARDEERVRTGNVDPTTRKQRYTPNDELKDLLAERASLKAIIKLQRQQKARLGKPERDAARQEQRAAEAIERSLDKIEKRIQELASGVVTPPRRILPFATPGLSVARALRDSRRRVALEMEKALKTTKSADQIREDRMVKAANAKKLRYQEMIDKGILTKPARASAPVTEAVDKARYEAALVEAEWNKLRSKMLWENRTIPSKVWSRVKTGLRATGVLRLGGDLSLLRQGGVWALSNFWRHPIKTASALARVARHGMTERGAYEIYQASQEALNTAGFTEKDIRLLNPIEPPGTGGRSRAAEEITGADILDMAAKLPKKTVIGLAARGLRAVEFFNTSILNIARAETALALRGSLDLPMSDDVRKAISIAAEVSSGRGRVTSEKIEAAIPFLNDWVFISARWTISRIQMATGYPLWSTKMSFETRAKLFHEIYLKTLIGRALMTSAIAALFPPEDDEDLEEFLKRVRNSMGFGNPLDPNYGKLKLKSGFSLDLAQGVSPLTGVFARITTGRTIRDGKTVDLRDEEKGRAVDAYLKNRANMVTASLIRTVITGRAYGGERLPSISRIYRTLEGTEEYPVNGPMLGETAKEWFAPIILADTKRIYQEFGPKGVVLWATMMSGAGVQSYQPKPKKEKFY